MDGRLSHHGIYSFTTKRKTTKLLQRKLPLIYILMYNDKQMKGLEKPCPLLSEATTSLVSDDRFQETEESFSNHKYMFNDP